MKNKASKRRSARSNSSAGAILGYSPSAWRPQVAKSADITSGKRGFLFYFGRRDAKAFAQALKPHVPDWQLALWIKSEAESFYCAGKSGPVWAFRPPAVFAPSSHEGRIDRSSYARARDQVGSIVNAAAAMDLGKLVVDFRSASIEEEKGALVGLELGRYSYMEARGVRVARQWPKLFFAGSASSAEDIAQAGAIAEATNIARHLVNVPACDLNPRTYAEELKRFFAGTSVEIEIWEGEKLKRERMGLLLAVGGAAADGPRLVILRHRPKGRAVASTSKQPVAVVGKGITFDSGGLDIKPSSGMRLMKKDMGGSAAVVGLLHWACQTGHDQPLDGYIPLAENAISANAFRPGDVIKSRAGLSIEIHNTDAEGRLVLADALDVAATQGSRNLPKMIINVATLTGAIKVALGADIAGLFSNDDALAEVIEGAAQATGDLVWRMPLHAPYKAALRSSVSDMANASDGFGGAITAALFLEPFVRAIPWAHLDVYAWKDGASGAFSEGGGSGQPTQALIETVRRLD